MMHERPVVRGLYLGLIAALLLALGAQGLTVQGTGSPWGAGLFTQWAADYRFVKDNVAFTFTSSASTQAGLTSMGRGFSSFVATPASTTTNSTSSLYSVPLFASAMTAAVNASLFANASATVASNMVAFDETTLVALFTGDLVEWSDPRLAALNPYVTLPPAGTNITLVLCNDTLGDANVLVRYLAAVSPALGGALGVGGAGLTSLPPFAQGRVKLACSAANRQAALATTGPWATSLVLLMLPELGSSSLAPVAFINANHSRLVASPTSITQAMTNAATTTSASSSPSSSSAATRSVSTELINRGGAAWPMATLVSILVQTDLSTADCSLVKELLTFVTWTQINDAAVSTLTTGLGPYYVALDTVLRKSMLDQLATIQCNGEQALTTAYLVGEGPPIPTYESWATDYESASFRLKYYSSGTVGAISSLLADAIDFGVSASQLTAAQKLVLPDVKLVPSLVFAINFAYNIPELADSDIPLLIDFQTAADIFLNKIQSWNHENITRLNPDIAALLPAEPIIVAYNTVPQSLTYLYTLPLSAQVPEFKARVGASTYVVFPVVTEDPARTVPCDSLTYLMTAMRDTPYAFSGTVSYFALTTPNVKQAAIINPAGNRVEALTDNILAAVANAPNPDALQVYFSPGNDSWPMVTYTGFMIKSESYTDCNKAKALVDWIYWTQSSATAATIASANKVAVASQSGLLQSRMLDVLSNVTCNGVHVSALYGCVSQGAICSNHGVCTSNRCTCESAYTGTYCESLRADSSSSDVLAPVLGSVLPAAFLLILLIVAAVAFFVILARRRRGPGDDWEIDFEELEMGELLGEGGYGQVHKATWKGSEVAVKMMAAETVTKAMVTSFTEEARTMSHLRHPNTVLFMAACTKPPRMCIVMEFMALGSLWDLIHNDLIPELPMALKVKIMFQAAKGMQFLHSSGIVHRDLKSLNLLLDAKWNVKVSDFGLTRFKSSLKSKSVNGVGQHQSPGELAGSVPWMAPEVLEEQNDLDYSLADVYSFGVIMWEVLTREQPYAGMMPAQIAVAVIRNDLRPSGHSRLRVTDEQADYVDLMSKCWHRDTAMRPVFVDVMKQLQAMIETMSSGSGIYTSTSGGSSSSGASSHQQRRYAGEGSDAHSSTRSGSATGSLSSGGQLAATKHYQGRGSVAPRRDVCFVVCDLARCNESWQANAAGTAKAIARYGQLVRDLSGNSGDKSGDQAEKESGHKSRKMTMMPVTTEGYLFSRSSLHSGGTFMLAFADADKAASFALALQHDVGARSWPSNVNVHSRVSLHYEAGVSGALSGDATRTGYDPKHFQEACRINLRCRPGDVICSAAFRSRLSTSAAASADGGLVRSVRWKARGDDFYMRRADEGAADVCSSEESEQDDDQGDEDDEAGWEEKWDQGMGLCSSNWCPWIINRDKITMGAKIGEGNFGRVVAGTYYGSPVAVKQLYKSRLDDSAMIKMRKEAAILSNMDHPHVVKLIGLSVGGSGSSGGDNTLMLVMEQVARGDLRRLLSDASVKLTWQRKVAMLRDAALGLAFLHSQGIIHRDIKSSNLLVEKSLAVKVGDFGFATAKQDNGTQTRCGTPSWTAPEIISGMAKYTEKADVYSFGIVMWEVLTRKVPYQDKNMMTVALDVINGQRPPVPADCPRAFAEVMQRCWTAKPEKRASMDDILLYLNSEAEASPV